MDKLEKVINGLECRYANQPDKDCEHCAYGMTMGRRWGCDFVGLCGDALELLKGQEPRVMALEEAQGEDFCWYEQRNFGGMLLASAVIRHLNTGHGHNQTELEFMGREDRIVRYDADYGKAWRCWTSRPTDEQREKEPWNIIEEVNNGNDNDPA